VNLLPLWRWSLDTNKFDEMVLAAFMAKDKAAECTLGDIILQKIREKVATGAYAFLIVMYILLPYLEL